MSDSITKIQDEHTAGPQLIGFDYQFYLFISLALDLKHGERIGFEVKDDVHIERKDGSVILLQAKHSVQKKGDGTAENLTTLDSDLWKTLSTWSEMVTANPSILKNHSFHLVTNKGEGNNKFLTALTTFRSGNSIDELFKVITEIRDVTKDETLKKYIEKVVSIGKKNGTLFFEKLTVSVNNDDIIGEIKRKILENTRNKDFVVPVFESLTSNLQMSKYIDIKEQKKFEISFDDFNNKFGKCFRVAFEQKPLPKRTFQVQLPDNLLDQIFIKQLLDIGEIDEKSEKVISYTTQMLQAMNHLSYWCDENLMLPTELEEFNKHCLLKWDNEFRAKYRQINNKVRAGTPIQDLEEEIKVLAVELVDILRRENLPIAGDSLGLELSNGHYYGLADKAEIGWHIYWEAKYKKT